MADPVAYWSSRPFRHGENDICVYHFPVLVAGGTGGGSIQDNDLINIDVNKVIALSAFCNSSEGNVTPVTAIQVDAATGTVTIITTVDAGNRVFDLWVVVLP